MFFKKKEKEEPSSKRHVLPSAGINEQLGGYQTRAGATSIFKIRSKKGYGANHNSDWIATLMPSAPGVTYIFHQLGQTIPRSDKQKIEKNLPFTIGDEETRQGKDEFQEDVDNRDRGTALRDLMDEDMPVFDVEVYVLIKGATYDVVKRGYQAFLDNVKDILFKDIVINDVGGEELKVAQAMFTDTTSNVYGITETGSTFSGAIMTIASGLQDKEGFYYGSTITGSSVQPVSIIKNKFLKNGLILGSDSFKPTVYDVVTKEGVATIQDVPTKNTGSTDLAMYMATNELFLQGTPTRHIMLQPFSKIGPDEEAVVIDISKTPINPVPVYGTEETVEIDTAENMSKLITMMQLLAGEGSNITGFASKVQELLWEWILHRAGGNGIYTESPKEQPWRANLILARDGGAKAPTLMEFLPDLKLNLSKTEKTEIAIERNEQIYSALNNAINSNQTVFREQTKLPKLTSNDLTVVYDISSLLSNPEIQSAMFINVLAYVAQQASPDEVVFIHGLQLANKKALPVIDKYLNKMRRRGVKFVIVADEKLVESSETLSEKDILNLAGHVSELGFLFAGRGSKSHFDNIQQYINYPLPAVAKEATILSQYKERAMYYRPSDRALDFMQLELVL